MSLPNLLFLALMVGVFWFLMVRPQQQRLKQQREMLAALQPGDEIVTIGGIYGRVVDVADRVRVAVADGSELEVARQAVAQVVPPTESEPSAVGEQAESEPTEEHEPPIAGMSESEGNGESGPDA